MKRQMSMLLAASLMLGGLTGCGGGGAVGPDAVPVQTVSSILGYDLSGNNRFTGIVEAKATQKVTKDAGKEIKEIKVEVGDEVKKGDVLFIYDEDAIKLSVETMELELEQLTNTIASYEKQIKELTKEKEKAGKSEQLSYSIQIQEAQLNKSEEEYNKKQKTKELESLKNSLGHAKVKAKVSGKIQAINGSGGSNDGYGYEDSGSDNAFITILETGVLQVKGTCSELNVFALNVGGMVTTRSRVDENQTWTGTISEVNTESPTEDNNGYDYYGGGGESASKYSFTVSLDDSEGLMMGQHVFIELGDTSASGLNLYSSYIIQGDEGAYVWAAKGEKLEQRVVTLGEYDPTLDTYEILDGLTMDDALAFPSEDLKEGDKITFFDESSFETGTDEEFTGDGMMEGGPVEGMDGVEGEFFDEGDGEVVDAGEYEEAAAFDGTVYEGAGEEGAEAPAGPLSYAAPNAGKGEAV